MNLREAAQQALEALIWTTGSADFEEGGKAREGALNLLFPAIADLRAALAEATIKDNLTVEPVAYVTGFSKGYAVVEPVDRSLLMCVGMALYRSPPKRKPLTEEDAKAMWPAVTLVATQDIIKFARAIERAHGIGSEE